MWVLKLVKRLSGGQHQILSRLACPRVARLLLVLLWLVPGLMSSGSLGLSMVLQACPRTLRLVSLTGITIWKKEVVSVFILGLATTAVPRINMGTYTAISM
jgi:hypothetical protein